MEVVLYGGTVLKWPSLPRRANMSFCPRHYHFSGLLSSSLFPIGFLLPCSSFISLPLLTLSLASSLPLSAFALHQCPEERGGAFQRPGDHSPLSASGPQSDRGIRIRIAVHSPQCPSDELEGAREGETEGAGGRRGMKGGGCPTHTPCSHWSVAFPLFLHRCRQFQVCFTHSGAHARHTCACTRKYTHWGPGLEHVHTRIRESTHIYTLSDENLPPETEGAVQCRGE